MSADVTPPRWMGPSLLRRMGGFALRVLRDLHGNQGLLLAGAVAYYTLLSIVPLFALILVGLSHFINEEQVDPEHRPQP